MSIKITWYGHASLSMEIGGFKILVDPFFTDNPAASVQAKDVTADYILVTHGHFDHVCDAVEIAIRTGAMVISSHEIAEWMGKQGVQKTHGQNIGGGHTHPFGYLKQVPALHSSSLPDGSYGGNPAGFLLVTQDGMKVYIVGDSGLFSDMELLGQEGIDLALVPIGDNYTMGPDDAYKAVELIKPKHVIPVHYNTWELIAQDAEKWAERVRKLGVKAYALKPGESITI
ncbi:MAG: metal-dependent hydrolase [Chloroflexi bacterium RBG_13_48_10]|jgi:L-ascorbate metabolism protein UlaG (beta-lactamase superfamily)|nr:MAG: metal-dependent hydrolase [Chloroflexi bacterium RBG_13_48_10]